MALLSVQPCRLNKTNKKTAYIAYISAVESIGECWGCIAWVRLSCHCAGVGCGHTVTALCWAAAPTAVYTIKVFYWGHMQCTPASDICSQSSCIRSTPASLLLSVLIWLCMHSGACILPDVDCSVSSPRSWNCISVNVAGCRLPQSLQQDPCICGQRCCSMCAHVLAACAEVLRLCICTRILDTHLDWPSRSIMHIALHCFLCGWMQCCQHWAVYEWKCSANSRDTPGLCVMDAMPRVETPCAHAVQQKTNQIARMAPESVLLVVSELVTHASSALLQRHRRCK